MNPFQMPDGSHVDFIQTARNGALGYLLVVTGPRDRTIYSQILTDEQGAAFAGYIEAQATADVYDDES